MTPPPILTRHSQIRSLLVAGRYREAEAACDAALHDEPADEQVRFFRAWAGTGLGKLKESEDQLERLLVEHPAMYLARYFLGDIARISRRPDLAAVRYGEALASEFALGPAGNLEERMQMLVELVCREPVRRWSDRSRALAAFGSTMAASGAEVSPETLARLSAVELPLSREEEFGLRFAAVCNVVAWEASSPKAWMDAIFEGLMLPWMFRALEGDRYDNALLIEAAAYQFYVKPTETEDHFRACFGRWKDPMRLAGQRFAASLAPVTPGRRGAIPKVAFFVHNVVRLAHVQTLFEVLEAHAELPAKIVEPYLFYIEETGSAAEGFRRAGVRVEPLLAPPHESSFSAAFALLRKRIAEEGIDVLAWISLAVEMPFAFGMRLAPRQVWWAMKYHALEFPEIDGYVTGGSQEGGTKTIQGRTWAVGPVAAATWFAPEKAAGAARVRADLGARGVIYGSFGREEKLNDPAFLGCVVRILREEPHSIFLWTGRTPLASIQERFETAGIADRCRFIGWVDTKLYAQVIDVFLDSFPFPCGFTLYEAMAAGKPVVLYNSAESTHGGIHAMVGPLLRPSSEPSEKQRMARSIFSGPQGESLYLRANSPDEYVGLALRLARDESFRRRTGEAARSFIEKLMCDRRDAARIYLDHVLGRPRPGCG